MFIFQGPWPVRQWVEKTKNYCYGDNLSFKTQKNYSEERGHDKVTAPCNGTRLKNGISMTGQVPKAFLFLPDHIYALSSQVVW